MTAPAIPAPATGRLGNGELRRQVAEWLAARPGPQTVGEIAKDLGRSADAVGNALTTLADRAEASRLAGKRPHRLTVRPGKRPSPPPGTSRLPPWKATRAPDRGTGINAPEKKGAECGKSRGTRA